MALSAVASGVAVIKQALTDMPAKPGVYRMLSASGDILYIGKAKHLKNRVANYTQANGLTTRILRMIEQVAQVEHTTTNSEAEALMLEASLIKKHKPRYNILLKDDKSFPFIMMTGDHPFPQITKHRGKQQKPHRYIGPFPSAGAVNHTLEVLQKAFLLRPCSDSYFSARTRPCLQYQIKRCSAPCVGYISEKDYAALIQQAMDFLRGRSQEVQAQFAAQMQSASDAQDYEKAALLRDRIRALSQVQHEQQINAAGLVDADVIVLYHTPAQSAVQVLFFREGFFLGSHHFFPRHNEEAQAADVLSAFVGQFYQTHTPASEILLSHSLPEAEIMQQALTLEAGKKITILVPQRGEKHALIERMKRQAQAALHTYLQSRMKESQWLEALAARFDLSATPVRIEVYDNSHIMGSHALGAMIVATPDGFAKSAYRKFNMTTQEAAGGDDYGMMRRVMQRRFSRLQKEDPGRTGNGWPDMVLIDGGAGQLSAVHETLAEMGITDIPLVAIAKGPDRNAGREVFHRVGLSPFMLPEGNGLLHYIQRLRDEAHRYAIGAHRGKRERAIRQSELDEVPGIGAARKKALLHHFGSKDAIARATVAELALVPGIHRKTAQLIYAHFNP